MFGIPIGTIILAMFVIAVIIGVVAGFAGNRRNRKIGKKH